MISDKIDLHTHSTASDGTLTPTQLAEYAHKKGLRAVALTDHDTINGVEEFCKRCHELGIEPIPGVEMSVRYECEMHILGLFIDTQNEELKTNLETLQNSRKMRNLQMLEKLEENGIHITKEMLLSQKHHATLDDVGRSHIARAMLDQGYVEDMEEAFDNYLGHGECCYIRRASFSPKEAIRMIHNAGGKAILAHPIFITEDEDRLFNIVSELKEYGLDGIECFYSEYPEEYTELCLRLCKSLKLLPSGGSDFHGENKEDIDLGCLRIPYKYALNLKK